MIKKLHLGTDFDSCFRCNRYLVKSVRLEVESIETYRANNKQQKI